jgi:ABC-type Fe3+ transport system substrate-binding protein
MKRRKLTPPACWADLIKPEFKGDVQTADPNSSGTAPGPAELAIRPRAVRLGVDTGELAGRIAKAAYLGDHMEYQVAVDGLAKELFVIDANVAAPLDVGVRVGIVLDADGAALVLP